MSQLVSSPRRRYGSGMTHWRSATPRDAPVLEAIRVAAWRTAYRGIVPNSALDNLDAARGEESFRRFLASGDGETYVVEHEGRSVGFVTVGPCRDRDLDPSTTGEIWGIYVSPDRWGRGIGTWACHEAEARLSVRGARTAVLWTFEGNDAARRFYESRGFALDGAKRAIDIDKPLPIVRYRKQLTPNEAEAGEPQAR